MTDKLAELIRVGWCSNAVSQPRAHRAPWNSGRIVRSLCGRQVNGTRWSAVLVERPCKSCVRIELDCATGDALARAEEALSR
jgi:hypothetical protein